MYFLILDYYNVNFNPLFFLQNLKKFLSFLNIIWYFFYRCKNRENTGIIMGNNWEFYGILLGEIVV